MRGDQPDRAAELDGKIDDVTMFGGLGGHAWLLCRGWTPTSLRGARPHSIWNQISIRFPSAFSLTAAVISSGSFLNSACACGSDLGCCGRAEIRLKPAPAPACPCRAPGSGRREAALDRGAEIGQAPAHHPVALNRGAAPQAADQLVELVLVQAPLPAGGLAVEQTCRPSHVEAVHPVAQGLAVHAGAARRVL